LVWEVLSRRTLPETKQRVLKIVTGVVKTFPQYFEIILQLVESRGCYEKCSCYGGRTGYGCPQCEMDDPPKADPAAYMLLFEGLLGVAPSIDLATTHSWMDKLHKSFSSWRPAWEGDTHACTCCLMCSKAPGLICPTCNDCNGWRSVVLCLCRGTARRAADVVTDHHRPFSVNGKFFLPPKLSDKIKSYIPPYLDHPYHVNACELDIGWLWPDDTGGC
jgi:hypothetical protein